MKIIALLKYGVLFAGIGFGLLIINYSFVKPKKANAPHPKVLIFSKANVYYHESIPFGIAAIKKLGAENDFDVDTTEDSLTFKFDLLKKYAALVFLSPTGKVFGEAEEKALKEYMKHGGGFVGIHSASDCEYNWQWYGDLVGGYFKSHPDEQHAKYIVLDKNHPSTRQLPEVWDRFDEIYDFKYLNPAVTVLIKVDEQSYKGGETGKNHPISWCHEYEGGRAFYTAMGHTNESYTDSNFLKHILGGIQWAMGRSK